MITHRTGAARWRVAFGGAMLLASAAGCRDAALSSQPVPLDAADVASPGSLDATLDDEAATALPADAGQDVSVAPPGVQDAAADAARIAPLSGLSAGAHVGVFGGYELPASGAEQALAERRAVLFAAGSDVTRVHVSFRELSPTPDRVDLSALVNAIAAVPASAPQVVALIETIDSDGYVESMPTDLVNAATPYVLRGGIALDAPAITARFARVLREFATTSAARRVVALSVGNEPDAYFDDVSASTAQGRAFVQGLQGFTRQAREALRAAGSGLPVAMTFRAALARRDPSLLRGLIADGDVAILNYYGQDAEYRVIAENQVASELDELVTLAEDKPVILQEVGCPAGRAGGSLGASEAAQAAFFSAVFDALQRRPQIRIAFVFQLVDWSPSLAASYGAAYASAGFPELGAKIEESLSTAGLTRYADGSPRAAFEVVRAGIARLMH